MELTLEQIRRNQISAGIAAFDKLLEQTENPMEINERLLMQILQDNKDTEYGKKNNFAGIHSIEEYQKNVPITQYEDYIAYIEAMAKKGQKNLITVYDVIYYSETSGTLGSTKLLPLTDKTLEIFKIYNLAISNGVLIKRLGDGWIGGRSMRLTEAKIRTLESGIQYGPVTSRMVSDAKPYIKQLFTSPKEAMFPHPGTDTRYLHARFGLMDKNITGLSSSYCSYLLEIMRYIENNHEHLIRDIENGTIDEGIKMSAGDRAALLAEIQPMPERALELRNIFANGFDTPIAPRLWPNLMYYATISTGFFTAYDAMLRARYLGNNIAFYNWGLNASEGLFSTTYDTERGDGALIPCSMFYEFLPVEAGDDFTQIVTMDKLEMGKIYEIILTNLSGLYRYRMGDAVRVADKLNNLPTIQFSYRIDRATEILDDHTSELALCAAAENTARVLGFELIDYSIYPDIDFSPARYVYFMEIGKRPEMLSNERIRGCLEKQLSVVNAYLGEIIEKGLCGATVLHVVQGETYLHYRDLMCQNGKSLAQLKPVRIIRSESQRRFFFDHIMDTSEKSPLYDK